MKASEASKFVTLTGLELEMKAQKPFVHPKTGLAVAEWKADVSVLKEAYPDEIPDNAFVELPFDYNNLAKYGDYTAWLSLKHLQKTAETLHPDFKNMWKWVVKCYPYTIRVSNPSVSHDFSPKDLYNFLRTDMVYLLFLLKYNLTNELEKWKNNLKKGNAAYSLPSQGEVT